MKIVAVIPARYSSTRLPGKPLMDICDKPMIYWVYNNVKKSKKIDELYVATDDDRIKKVCDDYGMNCIMTSNQHAEHISRIWEVSNNIVADYYICINGDEPLIDYKNIDKVIPKNIGEVDYFRGAFRKLTDPSETIDSANIKLVLAADGRCIYMSRTPVPYPKNNLIFNYNKYVGIECFTKEGLDFFHNTDMGLVEKTEDIDHIRFLENNKSIYFKEVKSSSISVDTKKDLEKVRIIMKDILNNGGGVVMEEQLKKMIDANDFISFDIFDTLLLRNIYKPTDIFRILDKIAKDTFGLNDFYNIRITSEMESRTNENNRECHYDDIYKVIEKRIKDKKIVNSLKNEELKLEDKFLVANPFMKKIYDYCIKKKKKVLIISDMYLDEKFIIKILKKNGFDKFKFYLSNKYQKTKGDTSLFEVAFLDNNINKEKWIHIGDNYNSDYLSPIKFGINAFHYRGVSTHVSVKKYSIFEGIILGIQNNYLYNGILNDYWDKFGVKYISLIYFGFTKWLYDLTKDLDNLFFIARDGYIIEKIYNLFNKDNKVKTDYLYCSRKSFVIPSLYKVGTEEFVKTLSLMYNDSLDITLNDFLLKCEVEMDQLDNSLITSFGFKTLDDKITSENIYYVKKMLIKLENNIRNKLKNKYDLAIKYLEQKGVSNYDKINIMDIGWAGSIQKSLKRLLDKDIIGYYFGTIDEKQEDGFTTMFGYFFDLDYRKEDKEEVLNNVMMYELIFSAPHGSTLGYEEKNGEILPILKDNVEYNKIIESFQNSAINVINKYMDYIDYFDYLTKDFCIYPYKNFIKERNYIDVKMFSKLSNDYILGSQEKFDYINTISEIDIQDDKKLIDISEKSLWKYTFIMNDNFTEEKYLLYKNKLYDNIHSLKPLFYAKVYLDYGNGFNEIDALFIKFNQENDKYTLKLNLERLEKDVYNVRIDPIENRKIVLRNLIIYSNEGNVEVEIPKKNYLLGKIRNGIYISSKDPKIIIKNTKNYKFLKFFANIELEK